MKKYIKPMMKSESFVSNEYVAACWWVNCNVRLGRPYVESNGKEGLQTGWGGDTPISMFPVEGCGTKHIGVTEKPVSNGYHVENDKVYEVFAWRDSHGWHSSYVDSAEWDTNPNAS